MTTTPTSLARLAGMMCNRRDFQQWAASRSEPATAGVSQQQHAAAFVRAQCGVTSRARLDHDAKAAALFHLRVRRPFLAWLGGQHR